jgi:hypothetical protein
MTDIQTIVNNMTEEQYLNLLKIADGEISEEIKNMTDDELLKELGV